jgi:hypothetical protein
MGQFQPGMSGNPDGRPNGISGGRVQALAALVGCSGGFPAFKHRRVTMAVTFNYVPHPAQRVIHEARGVRFRTVCTGRRFGKTLCLAAELLDRGGCECGRM